MKTNTWSEIFRWTLTTLIFLFYIAITFFSFRGNWEFLKTFEYYATTISATSIAWFLRWLWSEKGLETRLVNSQDIKDKERGKDKLVQKVNSNNLTDLLDLELDEINKVNKTKQYKNKCERKIKRYQTKKGWLKKRRYEYWKEQRRLVDTEDFNIDIVHVKYYKYDIDSMLSSTYKTSYEVETRGNLNKAVMGSYRTNIVTMVAFAVLGGLTVFLSEFSTEDLFVLLGRLLVFVMNIYSGYNLGVKFINTSYSKDLSKDYIVLKSFLKKHKIDTN